MKKPLILLLLLIGAGLAALSLLALPARAGPAACPGGFIIDNADSVNCFGMTGSTTLGNLIGLVSPRFVIESANATHTYPLTAAPAPLATLLGQVQARFVMESANAAKITLLTAAPPPLAALLGQVQARFVMESANAARMYPLTAAPAPLAALLGQVRARFVMESANAAKMVPLSYPGVLVGDVTPPAVIGQGGLPGGGGVNITVTTSELTTCVLEYGLSPGNYTASLSDPLFATTRQFQLSGLPQGAPVYYRFALTDRAGNTAYSAEYTLTAPLTVYLPGVVRRR